MGGGYVAGGERSGNHIALSPLWYASPLKSLLGDSVAIIEFVGSVSFKSTDQGGGSFEDTVESDDAILCCALKPGRTTGSARTLDKQVLL
jgi:hypothetical protein